MDSILSVTPSIARALYPIKEAEVILATSHAQIYRLINSGKLDARKIGARSFITASSLEAFLVSLPKVGEAVRSASATVRQERTNPRSLLPTATDSAPGPTASASTPPSCDHGQTGEQPTAGLKRSAR
jgi:hypothetical protein